MNMNYEHEHEHEHEHRTKTLVAFPCRHFNSRDYGEKSDVVKQKLIKRSPFLTKCQPGKLKTTNLEVELLHDYAYCNCIKKVFLPTKILE